MTEQKAEPNGEPSKITAKQWEDRIIINIPKGQYRKIQKGSRGIVMKNKQLYELRPFKKKPIPEIILKDGKKLTKSRLLALIKRF